MRVGIIGLGSIGQRHRSNLFALGYELVCYDTSPPWARTWDGFIEAYPHAVLICTPASTHATVAQQLLDAGYQGPLFVEKPLALSVEDAEVFARWPHPTTMVGYMLRFHDMARAMRAMYQTRTRGRFYVYSDMSQWPGSAYADPLLEYSHEIDLALWMGAPARVTVASRSAVDALFMLGGKWSIGIHWTSPTSERQWAVFDDSTGYLEHFDGQNALGDHMYIEEMKHFLDCAQRGVPTETPFADGIRVLDVIAQVEAMTKVRA